MYVEARKKLVDWVRRQLIGPPEPTPEGEHVLLGVLPTERFPCGALYPATEWGEGIDPSETDDAIDEDLGATETGSESESEPAVVRRYVPPSSLGLSFFITGDEIRFQVLCRAVEYQYEDRSRTGRFKHEWTRRKLVSGQGNDEDFENIICPGKETCQNYHKLEERARVDVRWRRFEHGWIVTVSLCNVQRVSVVQTAEDSRDQTAREYVNERAEKTLFEVGLRCVIDAGEVGVYPRVDRSLLDEEEQEIELQYAKRHIYAIGHGCAATWEVEEGQVLELRAETMPSVEVPQMTADTGSHDWSVLSLSRLADIDNHRSTVLSELAEFIDEYSAWIAKQRETIAHLPVDDQAAATRIVGRMDAAVSRMQTGLRLLSDNAQARLAFAIANRAMLNQMRQHAHVRGDGSDKEAAGDESYRWRPFQLAFLLTALESTANEDSGFRDTVDLIWFPTGGGKTEAYLGLVAFLISLRRLRHSDTGGGTAILMRYTLRLLTRDQFIRATRLICALELIRRERDDLGTSPITIGMWVGDATSPNSLQRAAKLVEEACEKGEQPPLVLDHCPWCGQRFEPATNYDSSRRRFRFLCSNTRCDFGRSSGGALPCNVVDEALYSEPPTMLVATVDKFARLAWEERANAFFGGERYRPPELIIQDELHLIAGALGSVAGLYEAAIDTVLQLRGVFPKYIASTATIRMAEQQVKRLYGREIAVFPPPGLDCDDSYFARSEPTDARPGRLYVGYLAPMLNRQQCVAPLAATLLAAPLELFASKSDERQVDESELLDAWWTQVVYHGSLQGVANSHTAFDSDVRDFLRLLSGTSPDAQPSKAEESEEKPLRFTPRVKQLTSRQTAVENAAVFTQLRRTRSDEENCLDAVLATNMISVGLDVDRLALMVINGQPLTTAEYIQASSRIGRGEVPGIVFANYYRAQARSLSHYESFRPYHEAFYRFVEPTSVTPYTYQARVRALHAALVIVMRHGRLDLLANRAAAHFDPESPLVARAVEQFKRRCRRSAPEHPDHVSNHIDDLVGQWRAEIKRCREDRRQLEYHVPDEEAGRDRLLYNHDDRIRGLWPTLHSMRSVENSVLLKVL